MNNSRNNPVKSTIMSQEPLPGASTAMTMGAVDALVDADAVPTTDRVVLVNPNDDGEQRDGPRNQPMEGISTLSANPVPFPACVTCLADCSFFRELLVRFFLTT